MSRGHFAVIALPLALMFGMRTASTCCALKAATAPRQSTTFTLKGEWTVKSSPINNQTVSRMGNFLGFPDRDMVFDDQNGILTGLVNREDAGPNVKPLGDWRINGENFSASFELWCPDPSVACGSVVMRGKFDDPDTIEGTMTVFFEQADPTTPTGLDTWPFAFHGTRK
ncbi:MAG TPA: hypothetical protein VJX67_14590 [Blastocatellia bacterium]|nr:hypothetical protein [Blastocatellia bacterium]